MNAVTPTTKETLNEKRSELLQLIEDTRVRHFREELQCVGRHAEEGSDDEMDIQHSTEMRRMKRFQRNELNLLQTRLDNLYEEEDERTCLEKRQRGQLNELRENRYTGHFAPRYYERHFKKMQERHEMEREQLDIHLKRESYKKKLTTPPEVLSKLISSEDELLTRPLYEDGKKLELEEKLVSVDKLAVEIERECKKEPISYLEEKLVRLDKLAVEIEREHKDELETTRLRDEKQERFKNERLERIKLHAETMKNLKDQERQERSVLDLYQKSDTYGLPDFCEDMDMTEREFKARRGAMLGRHRSEKIKLRKKFSDARKYRMDNHELVIHMNLENRNSYYTQFWKEITDIADSDDDNRAFFNMKNRLLGHVGKAMMYNSIVRTTINNNGLSCDNGEIEFVKSDDLDTRYYNRCDIVMRVTSGTPTPYSLVMLSKAFIKVLTEKLRNVVGEPIFEDSISARVQIRVDRYDDFETIMHTC